jgi:hypothetical protein
MAGVKREGNQIWVSIGVTKNTGNYESFRIDAGVTSVVEDVHDEAEWAAVWTEVDEQVASQLKEGGLTE